MAHRPLRTMYDNLAPAARGTRVSFQEPAAAANALGETQLSDTVPFDAVLLAGPESSTRLGGMSLLERAAFTMAGAGAGRILCFGERPDAALRLPAIDVTWTLGERADIIAWSQSGAGSVVILDVMAVLDAESIATFVAAPSQCTLRAASPVVLWRCAPSQLPEVIESVAQLAKRESAAVLPAPPSLPLPLEGVKTWVPPARALLLPANDAAARVHAQHALYARLGRSGDGWLTRLVDRRISRALTRLLLPTGVSPNQITLLSVMLGISSGLLYAWGSYASATAGALVFLLSTIVDGCDGEIARLTFRESKLGRYLDIIGDNVVHLFLFAGIAVGLGRRGASEYTAVLGVLLVFGALLAMGIVYWLFVRHEPTPRQRTFFEAFASREFAYFLVVMTVVGKLEWFLWAATVGTYTFGFGLLALGRRARMRTATRRQYTVS